MWQPTAVRYNNDPVYALTDSVEGICFNIKLDKIHAILPESDMKTVMGDANATNR
jgi:hypothetical protein